MLPVAGAPSKAARWSAGTATSPCPAFCTRLRRP